MMDAGWCMRPGRGHQVGMRLQQYSSRPSPPHEHVLVLRVVSLLNGHGVIYFSLLNFIVMGMNLFYKGVHKLHLCPTKYVMYFMIYMGSLSVKRGR